MAFTLDLMEMTLRLMMECQVSIHDMLKALDFFKNPLLKVREEDLQYKNMSLDMLKMYRLGTRFIVCYIKSISSAFNLFNFEFCYWIYIHFENHYSSRVKTTKVLIVMFVFLICSQRRSMINLLTALKNTGTRDQTLMSYACRKCRHTSGSKESDTFTHSDLFWWEKSPHHLFLYDIIKSLHTKLA